MDLSAIPLFKVFMAPSAHEALKPVLQSGRLATGPQVAAFETALAHWFGASDIVCLNDASSALMLALYIAGVRPGDEVIVSPLACAASLMPIANLFATPVWCDIDPHTGMLDPVAIEGLISERTRAILAYHWSGDVADLAAIAAVTKRHGLKLIQDATEAFGARYDDRCLGVEADFTVYSFYATKHINTGEGAALLAANPEDLNLVRRLRRFGIDAATLRMPNGNLNPQLDIAVPGFNMAMNEIAATLGIAQLHHADFIVQAHQHHGTMYETELYNIPGVQQLTRKPNTLSSYWTYSLRVERCDDLIRKLTQANIGAQRLHLRADNFSCFAKSKRALPGVAKMDAENLSLPCGWWISEEQRQYVVACIRQGW